MAAPVTPANAQVPADPDAPIVLDFSVHALRVALVSRRHILNLPESWVTPGIYVLLGELGGEETQVYVGKSVELRKRLNNHRNKPKIPWWRAVAVARDTTAGFNSAEIGYLEGRLFKELLAAPGISPKADKYDQDTTLPQHLLVQLDEFIPTILAALRVAGVEFEEEEEAALAEPAGKKRKMYDATVPDLLAAGLLSAGTTLVFDRAGKHAEALVNADGQIVVEGKAYNSPSTAAAKALGLKATNGWVSWRVGASGPTLADLRAELPKK